MDAKQRQTKQRSIDDANCHICGKARGAHYTNIACDASIFRDGPVFLFLDRWVTGTRPHAEFITSCLPCFTPSLITPTLYPDGSICGSLQHSELLRRHVCSNADSRRDRKRREGFMAILSPKNTHHSLVPRFGKGLFICNVPLHPAIGHHVAGDGGVVDCQRAFPAHHQGRLVQWLDLHAHWGTATCWKATKKTAFWGKVDRIHLSIWINPSFIDQ